MASVSWFGLGSKKAKQLESKLQQSALRASQPSDGSTVLDGAFYTSSDLVIDGSFQNSAALINEYRDMSNDPDVDMAVDDITNAIVTSEENVSPLKLNFSKMDISDKMVELLLKEFDVILNLLDFNSQAYFLVREWYVEGRQYFQPIIDEANKKAGIQKIVHLDSRTIQRLKIVHKKPTIINGKPAEMIESVEDVFAYNPYWAPEYYNNAGMAFSSSSIAAQTRKIPAEQIVYIHSGLKDPITGVVISDLEKSKKQLNNLKMMRDAQVIYRITRSVEKRVFKVDVGTLPPKQAEEFMKKTIREHKTKLVYDPKSGKVNGKTHQQSMLEDFWLPTRGDGRGSDVTTLAGAQNLSEIDDILYFQKLLYRSLNVPEGRLENQQPMLFGNRNSEITRDEWKFNKFIARKRRALGSMFIQFLKIQFICKGYTTEKEWDEYYNTNLMFDFASDSYAEEQQETDSIMNKFNNLSSVKEYVGVYISDDFIYEKILRMTPEEIKAEKAKIAAMPKPKPDEDPFA